MRGLIAFFAVMTAVFMGFDTQAQVTTSAINGIIKDDKGETLPGATVVALHLPSGTQYGTTTNASGNFSIQNMRIGGPYKVSVSFVGFGTKTFEDISLKLGEPYTLNVTLASGDVQLAEIVVTSNKNAILSSDRLGAVTNIGTSQIQALPSISRSINDLTRLTHKLMEHLLGGELSSKQYYN
ncbi:MAG: carboxypeptidase-like regulatory domain-containing protein [Spirosomataceae bacterium]